MNRAFLYIWFCSFIFIPVGSFGMGTKCDYDRAVFDLVKSAPSRKIVKDDNYRRNLVADIIISSAKYNLDPWLLISTIYRESSFKMNAVGKLGEKGLGQVHGIAKMKCDLKTQYGQIDCAASWLSKMINKCGSVNRGVSAYLSGKCKPNGKVLNAIRRRVRLAKRLKNGYCSN